MLTAWSRKSSAKIYIPCTWSLGKDNETDGKNIIISQRNARIHSKNTEEINLGTPELEKEIAAVVFVALAQSMVF